MHRPRVAERVDEFECILCLKLLYQPVTTPCGHTFCRDCFLRAGDHSNKCPMCRTVSSHLILICLCEPCLDLNAVTSAAIAVHSFMAWSGMSVVICMFDTMVCADIMNALSPIFSHLSHPALLVDTMMHWQRQ